MGVVASAGGVCYPLGQHLLVGPPLVHMERPLKTYRQIGAVVVVTGDWAPWLNVKRASWNLVEPKHITKNTKKAATNFEMFSNFL